MGKLKTPATRTNRSDDFLPAGAFLIRGSSSCEMPQPPLHRHDYFQIHVNLAGSTQQTLGATTLPIRPGTLSFILPMRMHRIDHVDNGDFFLINYRLGFLRPESSLNLLELEDLPIGDMPELAPFMYQEHMDFVLEGTELHEASQLCERMLKEQQQGAFYATEFIRADLTRLIGLVCRRWDAALQRLATQNLLTGSRRASLARVSRYIRAHLADPITLSDAAAAAFLSPNYLAHLLKRETGNTFVEIVTARRMDLACSLLANTDRPIAEIAARVGFEDEAYFSRRFRQLRGLSPSLFRQQHATPVRIA
ncbi:AraC-like DNA-binding protein [Ottowia thiooxydans]|uniref:AraC-like DNA-binding protein n=2 Tax=Ottowia thiooxydans TaxID=219182 RepID=A0ABV2QH12_9BURK